MPDELYKQLISKDLLQYAWYWTYHDSADDFMPDPLGFQDFRFELDLQLERLSRQLRDDSYHPSPLARIDVPKTGLAVRPGSVIDVVDRVVVYAIIFLLAGKVDAELPESVHSFRLKDRRPRRSPPFARDRGLLRFSLLKRQTILTRIIPAEPWFYAWPEFQRVVRAAYETQGFTHLVVSDVSAYFENINLGVLHDILSHYVPKEPRIINLLVRILQHWTWPACFGRRVARGIPQGSDVSSFLGNAYLLPLDNQLTRFCRRGEAQYFRYVDDVRVLCKGASVATDALVIVNNALRRLQLNMQGAKTDIHDGPAIRKELYDQRIDSIQKVIDVLNKQDPASLSRERREVLLTRLKAQHKKIEPRRKVLNGKDMRAYLRLLTAFRRLGDSYLVPNCLHRIKVNRDYRLLTTGFRYACAFPRMSKRVGTAIIELLNAWQGLLPLEEAALFQAARCLQEVPASIVRQARYVVLRKRKHPYVRTEAALLIEQQTLSKRQINGLLQLYQGESNVMLRRALLRVLCRSSEAQQQSVIRRATYDTEDGMARVGRMLTALRYDAAASRQEITQLFRPANLDEYRLSENMYKIEVLRHNPSPEVRRSLLNALRNAVSLARRPLLQERVRRVIDELERSLSNRQ